MAQAAWGAAPAPTTTDSYASQFANGAPLPTGQAWGKPDAAGANTGWEGLYGGQAAADKSAADRATIDAYEKAMKANAPTQETNTSGAFGAGGIIASAQSREPSKAGEQVGQTSGTNTPTNTQQGILASAMNTPAMPAGQGKQTIRQTLDSLQWTPATEKDSAAQLWNAAKANGWSSADIAKEVGWAPQTVDSLFSKYGLGNTNGGIIAGQTAQSGAAQLQNPTTWDVTKDQTVEGRIASIVGDSNNPLQVIARNNALEQSAARGLQNSSLAVSAGEKAAFEAALPIAQSDAATAAKAASWNADQRNQFAQANVNADNQFRMQSKDANSQQELALINRETQRQMATLQADLQAQANKVATDNKTLLDTNAQAASVMNQAVSAVSAIQNNANLDGPTKTQAIASVWRDVQTQLRVLGSVAGLDLTKDLTFTGLDEFNYNGGTPTTTEGPPGVSLDSKMPNGKTVGQAYQEYKAGGGTLPIADWYAIVNPTKASFGPGETAAGQ